jgi:hypothetical protein
MEWHGGPVEFDRVVPPSGNMQVAGKQFWLGPARAGMVIRFWASNDLIHLSAGGARIKTLRSHLSVNDLAKLAAHGGVPAGPSPLPPLEDGQAVEGAPARAAAATRSPRNRPLAVPAVTHPATAPARAAGRPSRVGQSCRRRTRPRALRPGGLRVPRFVGADP